MGANRDTRIHGVGADNSSRPAEVVEEVAVHGIPVEPKRSR